MDTPSKTIGTSPAIDIADQFVAGVTYHYVKLTGSGGGTGHCVNCTQVGDNNPTGWTSTQDSYSFLHYKELKNDHYTYRVAWLANDNEYVGLCAEFPSLSWFAGTPESALKGIRKVVAEVINDMKKTWELIPKPIANRHYSGKFVVRVTPETHRMLAIQSAETGVSLNRLVSAKISR